MRNIRRIFALLILIVLVTVAVIIVMKRSQVNIEIPAEEEKTMVVVGEYQEFEYTGGMQTYTAPVMGVYKLEVWGAKGEDVETAIGGNGGYSYGEINLPTNAQLSIDIGVNSNHTSSVSRSGTSNEDEYNKRHTFTQKIGSGGALTSISKDGTTLIIAGGGGGAAYGTDSVDGNFSGAGGAGGGTIGENASKVSEIYKYRLYIKEDSSGGTQSSAGKDAAINYSSPAEDVFGGAGGGYYRGGNGAAGSGRGYAIAPGSGGSGYLNTSQLISGTTGMQNGQNSGNGKVRITLKEISDNTQPTCTITASTPNTTNASSITYTLKFSEDVYNFDSSDIAVKNGTKGTFSKISQSEYTLVVTNDRTCVQTVSIESNVCNDYAGNGNIGASKTVTIDRTPPTCTITPQVGNPTNASSIQYNIDFSEAVYNFVASDIIVENGTITNFWGSGANYAITVTNGGTCTQTVRVEANVCSDGVGNGNTGASASRVIDRTLPTIVVNPASGGYAKSRNITITVGDQGGAGLNGGNSYQYYLSNSATALGDGAWTNYSNGGTYTIGAGKSGTYYLFTRRISDNVGNVSTSGGTLVTIGGETFHRFGPYYFDNTAPTVGTLNMKLDNSWGAGYTNNTWTNRSVYIEAVNGSDAHSGHNKTTYSVRGAKTLDNQTTGTTLTETGTYTITVTTTDNVGLTSTSGTYTVKIDKVIPTITVNPTSGGYVKNRNVTITVADTGGAGLNSRNSYQYYLSNSATTLRDGAWTNYTSGTACTIGAGKSGTYYLFVKRVTDNAGNVSTTGGTSVTISGTAYQRFGAYYFDNTPPVITKAELINNVVKIESSDAHSGLSKYRYITSTIKLANPSITAQNSTEKPATGQITIPNINDIRYIYVLVEDMVGNTSRIVEVEVPQITLEGEVNLGAEERKGGVDLRWQIGGKGDKTYKIYQKDVPGNQWREINTTNELRMTTSTSKDIAAPNPPTIKVNEIDENDKINISQTTTDNGSTYKFYATACDRGNNNIVLSTSGEITKEIKTGVKGYYYILEDSVDNEFNIEKATYTEEENLKLDIKHNGQYIRMKAVDIAGNISEENHVQIYITTDLKINLDGGKLQKELETKPGAEEGTVIITWLAGKRIELGDAEKEGHTYIGWKVKEGLVSGKNGILAGTRYTFGRENGEITAIYDINDYGYKIEYYYAGIKDESKTKIGVAQYSSIIGEYQEEPREGYTLGRTENYPLTIRAEANKIENSTITEEEANNIQKNIMKIYYEKRTDLEYTINYLEEGTNKVIHEPKEAKQQTFEEIIIADDEVIDIPGYYYERADKPEITIAVDKNKNVINLYYTKRHDLTYTVKYIEKGTSREIKEQKVVQNQLFESVVSTTEEIIEIDGYNYDSIKNDPITITAYDEQNIVSIYYTRRTDLSYTVKYIEKGTENEIHEQKIVGNKTFQDTIIAQDQVIPIDGYVYNSSNKDKITITTKEEENIIELYYTKRKDLSYIVNYLEEETHEELHEPKIVENQTFGDTIIAKEQAIKIEGYEYSSSNPTTIEIKTEEEKNVINIYYIKRSDLTYTVNYIDNETGNKIHESKKETNQVYGGKVLAINEIIEIDGYNYTNSDKEELTIGVEESNNVINMYYTIRKDIKYKVEYYYDGEKDESKTVEGTATYKEEITEYEEKMLEGYTLIEVKGMPLIIGTKEEINVIRVYYGTKAKVTIRYIDRNTEEILEEIIEEGYVGKEIELEAKDFENYVLVEEPEENIITMTKEEIIVEYKYAHVSSGVIEKHIDIDTGAILYNEVHEGNEGDEYKIEPKEFERYNIVEEEYPENNEGKMEIEVITVTYYYKKEEKIKITVKYLDKETKDRIEEEVMIEDYKGEEYKTEKKEIEGYEFVEVVGQAEGKITEEQEIIYYYQKIKVPDNKGDNPNVNGSEGEGNDSTTTNGRIPNAGMVKQVITGTAFIAMIVTISTLIVFAIKGTIIYKKYKK